MYGLFLFALSVVVVGQRALCQLLPDLSDPCASSATQLHDNDIAYFAPDLLTSDESPDTSEGGSRRRRGATSNQQKLWPNGVIYYTVSSSFSDSENRTIHEAMQHWENNTCVRFKPHSNQTYYVRFFPGSGCCSYVGRITYGQQPQGVSLGRSCFYFHTVVHEIGHVVGFWHEQSRPDRDQYIEILSQNIVPGYEGNFNRLPSSEIDSLRVGYDYNSIMHYDSNFFSRHPSLNTLRARDPSIPVGGARVLSQLDIEQTNRLYNCDVKNPPPLSVVVPPLATPPPFPSVPYSCVHRLTSLEGSFRSPGYPVFSNNVDCVWMIKVSEGYQIRLTFAPVELENAYPCNKDFIKVYDNFQFSGESQTICGFYTDYYFTVGKGSALVHYHTDATNDLTRTHTPLAGFKATYRVIDINECTFSGCSHGCRNLPGSYECTCPRGFYLSADGHACFDMNECALGNGGCGHECVNTGGSFRCQCRDGYELQSDGHTCRLQGTSCSPYNGGCHHICTETPTSKICSCRPGYKLHSDSLSCIDDNECYLQRSGCQHRCTNTIGSYVCSCHDGFRLANDEHTCTPENKCSNNNGGCGQRCRDTNSGVVCSCNRGYRLSVDQRSCEDIDECIERRGTCLNSCVNTNGSYYCTCSEGLRLSPDHRSCSDIDECATGENKCPFKDRCINYYGTYRCTCPSGYRSTPDGQGCEDMDECALWFSAYCSHTCHNLPGGFECQCPSGYILQDLYTCVDMNECASRTHSCDRASRASCQNTVGSYVCTCPDGYIVDETGLSCLESVFGFECEYADECDEGFVCAESEGVDYMTCQCPPGHTLSSSGLTCEEPPSTEVTTEYTRTTPTTGHVMTYAPTTERLTTSTPTTEHLTTSTPTTEHVTTSTPATERSTTSTPTTVHVTTSTPTTEHVTTSTPTTEHVTTSIPATERLTTSTPATEGLTTSTPTTERVTTSTPTTEHVTTSTPTTERVTTSTPTTEHVTTSTPTTEHVTTSTPTTERVTTSTPTTEHVTTSTPTTEHVTTSTPTTERVTTSTPTTEHVTTSTPTTEHVTTSTPTTEHVTTSTPTTEHVTTSTPTTEHVTTSTPTTERVTTSTSTKPPTTSPTELYTTAASELSCGGDVSGENGSFHSDNWPETYPVNVDCVWRIELSDPTKLIAISFDRSEFGIAGKMPACTKDWIKVFDGHSYEDSFWGPLCSFWKPQPIQTTSHRAMVVFHSGPRHNKSRKGFRLIFTSVDGPTTVPTIATPLVTTDSVTMTEEPTDRKMTTSISPMTSTTTSSVSDSSAVETTSADIADVTTKLFEPEDELCTFPPPPKNPEGLFRCGVFVTPGMKFGTPGFPAPFNTSTTTSCNWLFFESNQRQYQLRFLYFDLPASPNCTEVNLKLYNGFVIAGEPLATLCGHLEPTSRIVRGSQSMMVAVLHVNTEEPVSFRGMHALFEEVSEESLNP